MKNTPIRQLPIGAEAQPDGSTHFRVWAPEPRTITLVIEPHGSAASEVALDAEPCGYYSALVAGVGAGDRYRYRLDGTLLPDPVSRWQPDGPFGPSAVVDPRQFAWTDGSWRGVQLAGQIVYELHVGTFTRDGTWRAAIERLPQVAATGISLIELMPVAEFPGRFGWGYDGVFPFAPTRLYGTPDDLRAFVDRAHAIGLGVILDVVYNHFGPDGCVFTHYAQQYFTRKYTNEWGDAINFDGEHSGPVRELFASNAAYWIDEFHLDGLRLDATQSMHDASPRHVLADISRAAHRAAGGRGIVLVAENEPQHVRLVKPIDDGGFGLDALWNDDFHHSAVVAVTGRREAYYTDHGGTPQELISAAKYGYLFQGQRYEWQKQSRGTRTDGIPPAVFVNFIENHDQLANSGSGARVYARTSPGRYRALTALLLLMPGTPMLFQGQEFGASAPFLYFADQRPDLATLVQRGRAEFVSQFPSLATAEVQARLPVPHDPATFAACKLDWGEYDDHQAHRRLHADLIGIRCHDEAFRAQRRGGVDGAVLAQEAFALRFAAEKAEDERLLIVNLGPDIGRGSLAEPLVAPPDGYLWQLRWSSEHPAYGGGGTPDVAGPDGWRIPAHAAVVLRPTEIIDGRDGAGRR
jgi:maltooligosyltrehalose trehalohydrolase